MSMIFASSQVKWCLASVIKKSYSTDGWVFADQIFHYGHRSLFARHVERCHLV